MASTKRPTGATSARITGNLRRARKRQGVSTYTLSDRLTSIGWPIQQSGITRIERGERRVDADDLVALAICLDVSPNRLFLPDIPLISTEGQRQGVVLVGSVVADTADIWSWATGEKPLVARDLEDWEDADEPSGVDRALFAVENQPHRYVGGYAGLAYDPYGEFGVAMRAALNAGVPVDRLREELERMVEAADRENSPDVPG